MSMGIGDSLILSERQRQQWQCVPARQAELDELHDLLDCIQADGSIAGLDEFAPDGSATFTLCQTLYDLLVAYDDLRTRDREVNATGRLTGERSQVTEP